MDGQIPPVLQDFLLNLNHTLLKQGTGTTDHLLPLGCFCFSSLDLGLYKLNKGQRGLNINGQDLARILLTEVRILVVVVRTWVARS